jgi:hypothetical protein
MYDPTQPRIPKHHHGGGRWTRGAYGMLSDVGMPRPPQQEGKAQPTLADLPHYSWLRDPLQRERPRYDFNAGGGQLPTFDPAAAAATAVTGWGALNWFRGGITEEEARGWEEYERLSEQNSANRRAVIKFKVRGREYRQGRDGFLEYDGVEVLTGDQVKKVCTKLDTVEELIKEAAKKAGKRDKYQNEAAYGREVHFNLKTLIGENPQYGLKTERSFIISGDENEGVPYGTKDSRRTDAEEPVDPETLCLHDLKTGKKGLRRKYMREIAEGALRKYPKVRRIVVTEVKAID